MATCDCAEASILDGLKDGFALGDLKEQRSPV